MAYRDKLANISTLIGMIVLTSDGVKCMDLIKMAQESRDRELLRIENLIDLELLKRRIAIQNPSFNLDIKKLRETVKSTCLRYGINDSFVELEEHVDTALDCLQFGMDHGIATMHILSEQAEFSSFVSSIQASHDEILKNIGDHVNEIMSHESFPKGQRLAEISYENDLRAGYYWWLGAKGKIPEEDRTGILGWDGELKSRWNAIRTGATLNAMPCRTPPIKLKSGNDYEITQDDYEDAGDNRINLHISLGMDVDRDRMVLDLLNNLAIAWSSRDWMMLNNGVLCKENCKSLVFDSDELRNKLKKKVFQKTIKEDEIEPFFLGVLCWDEKQRLGNVDMAIQEVLAMRQAFGGNPVDESMHDRIRRCYVRMRKIIVAHGA